MVDNVMVCGCRCPSVGCRGQGVQGGEVFYSGLRVSVSGVHRVGVP